MKNLNKSLFVFLSCITFFGCSQKETTKVVKTKYTEEHEGYFDPIWFYVTSVDGYVLLIGHGNKNNLSASKIYDNIKEGDSIEGEWESVVKIKVELEPQKEQTPKPEPHTRKYQ